MADKKDGKPEIDKTEVADSDTLKIRLEEAKSSAPVLVVISGRPLGKSFFVTRDGMILGRDLEADIQIAETAISRKHTEFKVTDEGIVVVDLGSTNGTYVNDVKIGKKVLQDGDLIRTGNTILKFLKEGKIENIHYNKMYDLATRDDLTQALNKKAILELIAEEFSKSLARELSLCLIMFDLDHFKQTNDKFGHLAGDFVLKETCAIIKNKMIRSQDALGRYGGEEFSLLLRETPLRIAVEVAERIRSTIEKHRFLYDSQLIPVTVSMGVVSLDSTCKSPDAFIAMADKALYDAKNSGRNKVCVR
ncbi:MAG: GGDEF domain-containing protein [Deltaproteobacteria bacterium]|nr:GGDEF domain-containing protein [Deltaproteobacteria bacterium]MBI3295730.1 GGDEF domain-containing protein [Deltaproteobacteria bacterium]